MLEPGNVKFDPGMFRLLEYRPHRRRKIRIRHRANSDADHPGHPVRSPVNGRAAVRAKVAVDHGAAVSGAAELCCGSRDRDGLGAIKRPNAKRRTGSPLAIDAVTGHDQLRWFGQLKGYGAATTLRMAHQERSSTHCESCP